MSFITSVFLCCVSFYFTLAWSHWLSDLPSQGIKHGGANMDRGRGGVNRTSLLQQHPRQDATTWRHHRHPTYQSECCTRWMPGSISTTGQVTQYFFLFSLKTVSLYVIRWAQDLLIRHITRGDTVVKTGEMTESPYSYNRVRNWF